MIVDALAKFIETEAVQQNQRIAAQAYRSIAIEAGNAGDRLDKASQLNLDQHPVVVLPVNQRFLR